MRLRPIHFFIALVATCTAFAAGAASAQPVAAAAPTSAAAPSRDCPPAAVQPTAEELQAALRTARDRGFLWRIRKDGHDSWLYGTLHVGKLDWSLPGPRVNIALKASDTIALELDPLAPDAAKAMASAVAEGPLTPLPPDLQARLDRVVQSECLPPKALASLPPALQIAALSTLIGRRDGLDPAWGTDMILAGFGHKAKRRVVALETPQLQVRMLKSGTPEETDQSVDHALAQIESGAARPALLRIAHIWADSDYAALADYGAWCECTDTPADRAEMARMLDERNPAMADAIAALHAGGARVFAAVGSLHMVGPQGLPALLAARGYRVERIQPPESSENTP